MDALDQWAARELFITEELDQADPIWGQIGHVYKSAAYGWVVLGARCGSFRCSPNFHNVMQGWPPEARAKLTTWITDQNRLGDRFPAITDDVLLAVSDSKPLRFSSKVDRFFLYLNDRRFRIGEQIFPATAVETPENIEIKNSVMRWIEAVDEREMWGFMRAIEAARFVVEQNSRWLPTVDGLMRLDSLDSQGAANDQAFVAMWFGPEMSDAYEKGIKMGLADAGYRAFRIDEKEHSNKIDDEIIAEIRRSRFVVADFTSGAVMAGDQPVGVPRGGVYYEAGFAQGLNMPVIWTVREDQVGLVHFDTRQFNHITWKDADDLRVKLYRRVAAVLGHFRAV